MLDPLATPSLLSDPFRERSRRALLDLPLLGNRFEFETESPELRRLVESAFAGLPRHRSSASARRFLIRLRLDDAEAGRSRDDDTPPLAMLSGGRLLAGIAHGSAFAVIAPDNRSAIINVSRSALRDPRHVRYELIEFAVYTLASRSLGWVPLHAGCVGTGRQGLLLIGDSGAGKSTLTLQCALAGLDLLSEDSVLVDPRTLNAAGIPNFAHLCRDGLRFFSPAVAAGVRSSPKIRRRSGAVKFEIDLRDSVFSRAVPPLRLVSAVFLSRRPAPDGELLAPLTAREASARLRATQSYGVGQRGWKAFSRLMTARPAFELFRPEHPAEAALMLKRLLAMGKRE